MRFVLLCTMAFILGATVAVMWDIGQAIAPPYDCSADTGRFSIALMNAGSTDCAHPPKP